MKICIDGQWTVFDKTEDKQCKKKKKIKGKKQRERERDERKKILPSTTWTT